MPGLDSAGDPSAADLEAARAGDRLAAARVLAALLPRVRNLVRYLIRGDREVDDVVQEASVSLLRGLGGYRGEGLFRSWADRVVARTTFAWLGRRREQEQQVQELPNSIAAVDSAQPLDEFLARRRVVVALDGLPFEQRHALVLHHVLEMSVPEVAQETGAPIETVRSRLRLGRARLREALTPSATQKVS